MGEIWLRGLDMIITCAPSKLRWLRERATIFTDAPPYQT